METKQKRPNGYWTKYYQEHREQRLAESKKYGEINRDQRKKYLAEYYQCNKDKYKLTEEQEQNRRSKTRERYRSDPAYRQQRIRDAKEYRKRNPETRIARSMRKYGSSLAEYLRLAELGCAICGAKESGDKRGHRLHIDHDHITNRFRGLLCTHCNLGIGKFHDDPGCLEAAALYLRLYQRKSQTDNQE